MPVHCPPWPGQTKQTFGAVSLNTATPASPLSAKSRNCSTSAAAVSAAKATRCDNAVRHRAAVQQISPTVGADGNSSRAAISPARRCKACGLRAESGRRAAGAHRAKAAGSTEGGGERASSSTTWAFVPAMPSAVTPATLGPSLRGSAVTSPGMISASSAGVSNGLRRRMMKARRDAAMMEDKRSLNETGDACRGFRMAPIGLCRSDKERPIGRSIAACHRRDRFQFDGIARTRACAMGFQI